MTQNVTLIVNTKSRRGRDCYEQAQRELKLCGVGVTQAIALRHPADAPDAVGQAIAGGASLVIVGGGDGTLGGAAGQFVGKQCVMGVLPLGTGNEFARDLNIPADVCAACSIIANGQISEIDLGIVNGRYFVNVATVGLTTLIAQELTPEAKHRFGKFVYVFALIRALTRVRPFHAVLETPEGTLQFDTLQVVIGNGRFHAGPFPLAPNATITDGKLVVYALAGTSRWTLLRYALNLPGGHQVELPDVPAVMTTGGSLHTSPVESVTVDGEIALQTPLNFGIVPRALRVMTPSDFAAVNCSAAS